MRLAKIITAVAVASMATVPALAAPAASLSLSRASTDAENANEVAPAIIIGIIAGAALIGGVVAIVDDKDEPASP